ncbi:maleylpyruvate isomerase N-terminal domain-containing protein [Aquipuribacter hungaricus]|uniref:Maleylpyruvate isomerase N-terminal domain-containing protein n=1 Tax=Aquipuribacter hungaricus TaxID=545624 RepID=A0ABV7WLM8_9MICO
MDARELLRTAYGDLSGLLLALDDDEAAQPTGCAGWAVLDLAQHLVADVRRGLVALATPADPPATSDAVGYWRSWQQSAEEAADDRWRTRAAASLAGGVGVLAATYRETTDAVLVLAGRVSPGALVRTQGHVLRVDALLSTLVVEACVHHLDLVERIDRPGPRRGPLGEVRRVVTELAGQPLPEDWDDATAARRGTGREALTPADRLALGTVVDRFPVFA